MQENNRKKWIMYKKADRYTYIDFNECPWLDVVTYTDTRTANEPVINYIPSTSTIASKVYQSSLSEGTGVWGLWKTKKLCYRNGAAREGDTIFGYPGVCFFNNNNTATKEYAHLYPAIRTNENVPCFLYIWCPEGIQIKPSEFFIRYGNAYSYEPQSVDFKIYGYNAITNTEELLCFATVDNNKKYLTTSTNAYYTYFKIEVSSITSLKMYQLQCTKGTLKYIK